ncbi:hypothetical protein [Rhizobium sp. Root1220]|uniref:hypothetical protein n=1 Tax=Rhizobium sp. Root1220 TaxID=1736432 RepID=UPI000701D7AB|nr:hypothetical protein [Rhizobium sp. Root1220]KQV70235.1 hypothetical protein ASC90_08915 [Rhizobium sp. Root1220]
MHRFSSRFPRVIVPVVTLHALGAFLWLVGAATAQQPTTEQRNAIRSACRSDFIAQCSGVTPGGMEALTCLQQHSATLSANCREAVSAISPAKPKPTSVTPAETKPDTPAPVAAATTQPSTPTQAQHNAIKSACSSDFMAQCGGVTPGGAEALSCLQTHSNSLSASCQQAVGGLGSTGGSIPAGAPVASEMPPANQPTAMPAFSPREELFVIRETCGGDFRRLCGAVPLGGGRGIACLRQNLPRVSAGCQKVLMTGL